MSTQDIVLTAMTLTQLRIEQQRLNDLLQADQLSLRSTQRLNDIYDAIAIINKAKDRFYWEAIEKQNKESNKIAMATASVVLPDDAISN